MKKAILATILTLTMSATYVLNAEELVIKGLYQGIDLYVMNPMLDESGDVYCVKEIFINDVSYQDVINSSAFCLSLSSLQLPLGKDLEIRFIHGSDCAPRIINPEVLKTLSTYSIIDLQLSGETLSFTTQGESSKIAFVLEEYRWNRWVKVGEVQGKGGPQNNSYTMELCPVSGKNKYRVSQTDHLYRTKYSEEFEFVVDKEPVKPISKLKGVKAEILFNTKASYRVLNIYGELLMSGIAESIDVSTLSKGTYVLAYENTFVNFTKK